VTSVRDGDRDGPARPPAGDGRGVRVGAYVLLFVLGALQALIGTFQFSRGPSWSLVAICFAVAIGVTCLLGSWGMRAAAGGVLPAAGWFIVSVLLGTSSSGGSVLVTNTPQGKWFLFGGAVCAAAGAIISFAKWTRPKAARRPRS
jgi:Family of unknown function (DUF6113)